MFFIENSFILSESSNVLTQAQKLEALRNLGRGRTIFNEPWFITTGFCVVALLILILHFIRKYRDREIGYKQQKRFIELADLRCLKSEEIKLLIEVTRRSGLKNSTAIFTMSEAFDNGASVLMQDFFSQEHDLEDRKKLYSLVVALKSKLGYEAKKSKLTSVNASKGLSSKHVPVGKRVSLSPADKLDSGGIEAVVVESDNLVFHLQADYAVGSKPGDVWRIRYRFGSSVWQFNAVVMQCDEKDIVFNHSEKVRFINRRRFLRVEVAYPAKVALFDCLNEATEDDSLILTAPEFRDAKIIELSGPGLKIVSPIKVSQSQRIIVVFEIDEKTVLQDIAEVRHCEVVNGEIILAVELVGLNENAITKLVKMTNTLALKNGFDYAQENNNEEVMGLI